MGIPSPEVMPEIENDLWYVAVTRVWICDFLGGGFCKELEYRATDYLVFTGEELKNSDWGCIRLTSQTSGNIVALKGSYETQAEAQNIADAYHTGITDKCVLTEMLEYKLSQVYNFLPESSVKGHHHINHESDTISVLLASKAGKSKCMIQCEAKTIVSNVQ